MLDSTTAAWMTTTHERLYHVVYRADHESRASIEENGLVAGTLRHRWHPLYLPRDGHVYLATGECLPRVRGWGCTEYPIDVYAVDSAALAATRINPDEDWFFADDWIASTNMIGDQHACQVFNLPLPPTQWMWQWADYLKLHPLPSYGEWAEAVDLGCDPAQTAYSLERGSIAYRGDIPPSALRLIHTTVEGEA